MDIPFDPKHFPEEICKKYNFSSEGFARFLEDYTIIPQGELPPDNDEPVSLTMDEISEYLDIPKKILRQFQYEDIISRPITVSDFETLKVIQALWGRTWYLRAQLVKYSQEQREELIQRPGLISKWERWAYSRFANRFRERDENADSKTAKKRETIKNLAEMIEGIFGVPNCENTRTRLREIKKMAENDRYTARKKNLAIEKIAEKRGVDIDKTLEDAER